MANKPLTPNANLLEQLWDEADPEVKQQAPPSTTTTATVQPPAMEKQSTMRIQITGPTGSSVPLNPLQPETQAAAVTEEKKEPAKTPPSLVDSAAFSTMRMFHEMGLAGDVEDIFDEIPSNTPANANGYDSKLDGLMNGDSGLNPLPESVNIAMLPDEQAFEQMSAQEQQKYVLGNKKNKANGEIQGNGIPNGHEIKPQPIKGGKRRPKKKKKHTDDEDDDDDDEESKQPIMAEIQPVVQEYHETTARKDHDVKDMDSYQEITPSDLEQFEAMLSNTEHLINEMIDVCKHNGYGLGHVNEDGGDMKIDMNAFALREDALKQNVSLYGSYVSQQLAPYNFNLSSNAIVDLMGVRHTMKFRLNKQQLHRHRNSNLAATISSQGYVLYDNKRLTPHYYFNVLDDSSRRAIDVSIDKMIRDYLRDELDLLEFNYPTARMLKGITPILIDHFEERCRIFYTEPYCEYMYQEALINEPDNWEVQDKWAEMERFCVIVFPNHKPHLNSGMWSRSVTYFDNVIRGTMFQFIEQITDPATGWGLVLLNPNEREIESETFGTKAEYDEPESLKNTETITIPRHESSFAHVVSMWNHFIKPWAIQRWGCKLLLLSHCDGGDDIIHLLETQQDSHEHIIGIAMLDYYNWSLNHFSKKTRQIIEQKAAIYMSLYGSNTSAYGLELTADKSPVTIFRTANKEKRYSPCYNEESVVRFFKSKIELNRQDPPVAADW
eukprot:243809_1